MNNTRIKQEKAQLWDDNDIEMLYSNDNNVDVSQVLNWSCEFCEKEFQSSSTLLEHKRENHFIKTEKPEYDEMNENYDNFNNFNENDVAEDTIAIKHENIIPTHCNTCSIEIEDYELMEPHLKFHQPRTMVCPYCHDVLPSPQDLYKHSKTLHKVWKNERNPVKWFCEVCETMTGSSRCMKQHLTKCKKNINVSHVVSKSICEFCKSEFKSSNDLLRHQRENHYIKEEKIEISDMHKVDACDAPIEETLFVDTIDIKHENILLDHCDKCDITIEDCELMESHLKFHQPRPMRCRCCKETLPSPYDLYVHTKTVHNSWVRKPMKWFCDVCEMITGNSKCIKEHLTKCKKPSHPQVSNLTCETYRDEFESSDDVLHQNHEKPSIGNENVEDCAMEQDLDNSDESIDNNVSEKSNDTNRKNQLSKHCKICDIIIHDTELMEYHLKFHEPRRTTCPQCKKDFDSPYEVFIHKQTRHRRWKFHPKRWFCEKCEKFTSCDQSARQHLNECVMKMTQCKYCDVKLPRKTELQLAHLEEHYREARVDDPNVEKYKCKYCDKIFIGKSKYRHHLIRHRAVEVGKFKCTICKINFTTGGALRGHMQGIHEKKEEYKCSMCSARFSCTSALYRHEQKHKKLTCTQCQKEFADVKSLDQHLVEDHNTRPRTFYKYFCKHCDRGFATRRTCEDHQNVHTGERPYSCKFCSKTFSKSWQHSYHERGHESRAVSCDYCGKKFASKFLLRGHIPKHLPPEDWKCCCEICGVNFPNHHELTAHMRKDKDNHVRSCDLCGLQVLGMNKLRKHWRREHATRD